VEHLLPPDQGVHDQRLKIGAGDDADALAKLSRGQRRVRRRAAEDVPLLEDVHADVPDRQVVNLAEIGSDLGRFVLTPNQLFCVRGAT
jgi:hypothetical protein